MPAQRGHCVVLFQYGVRRRTRLHLSPLLLCCVVHDWYSTEDFKHNLAFVASLLAFVASFYRNRLFSFFYDDNNAMVSVISKSSLLNCTYLVPNIL